MKPRPPFYSDADDNHHHHHHHHHHHSAEELTPLMLLPRHVDGNNNKALPAYYHYGDCIISSNNSLSAATLKAENRHDIVKQQSGSSSCSNISNPAASLFVAQIYTSHHDGSTYIRYQPAALLEKSNNDKNINNNNKKCWRSDCHSSYFHCSQQQRRGCILFGTLIGVILLFLGLGGVLFHNNNNNASTTTYSTPSTTGSSSIMSTNDERGSVLPPHQQQHTNQTSLYSSRIPRCGSHGMPCFYPGRIQVQPNHHQGGGGGFPSYWDYAGQVMNVTANNNNNDDADGNVRSILINGNRVMFLAGSMDPVRATRASWELALDEAVRNGLNLVTIDIFWSTHQPLANSPLDWSMTAPQQQKQQTDDDNWQLRDALYSCASRGLFVHLRIVVAASSSSSGETSLGGIPEWLLPRILDNDDGGAADSSSWQTTTAAQQSTGFVKAAIDYIHSSQLWALQGGPIIMAQVENELVDIGGGGREEDSSNVDDDDDVGDDFSLPSRHKTALRHRLLPQSQAATTSTTTRANADDPWCAAIVANLSRSAGVWTMCNNNGRLLAANNDNDDSSGHRRIPVDQQPGAVLWTIDDGGFQQWGGSGSGQASAAKQHEDKNKKKDDWRKTAAGMSHSVLRWFARGGTHLNYNMWWGGYNRGRLLAAASMLNAHDTRAVLCPSGERHQPKFAHFQALHAALAEIAPILLLQSSSSTARLDENKKQQAVQLMNDQGQWELGGQEQQQTIMFVHQANGREAIFVENNLDSPVVARVPCSSTASSSPTMVVLEMQPHSSILLIDGTVRFDSGATQPRAMAFARRYIRQPVILLDWATWQEPMGVVAPSLESSAAAAVVAGVHVDTRPLEQTALNMNDAVLSDYAWYQTSFTVENHLDSATLRVDTQKANGIVAFLDGKYIDAADNHDRSQGATSLYLSLGSLKSGTHQLALLSESFGYNTLTSFTMPRNQNTNGAPTVAAQLKGITGDVVLSSPSLRHNMNLVDGRRQWLSFAGLHAERASKDSSSSSSTSSSSLPMSGVWREHLQNTLQVAWGSIPTTASWSAAYFDSPRYDPSTQGLYLHIKSGRGHLWLNGHDLGRYWNITRGGSGGGAESGNAAYSQEYYFLPSDYLNGDSGRLNEIVLFDVFGGDHGESELVISWTEAASDDDPSVLLLDQVDFPDACLV